MRQQYRHVFNAEFSRADIGLVERLERARSDNSFGDDRHEDAAVATPASHGRHVAEQLAFDTTGGTFPSPSDIERSFVAGAFHGGS